MKVKVSCSDFSNRAIMYAMTMVGDRETPAWQWTNTRPFAMRAASINIKILKDIKPQAFKASIIHYEQIVTK